MLNPHLLLLLALAQKLVFVCFSGLCPVPHILFCLDTKKDAKKIKAASASHQKLSLGG